MGARVDGLTVRRLRVDGTRDVNGQSLHQDCASLVRPLRNAVLEDVELRDCGREGMLVTSVAASTRQPRR